jgi:hypothetical protein
MNARRTTLWHRLLAVIPALLVLGSLPGQALLRCRMDGQLRSACCCPVADSESAPPSPAVSAGDCCRHEPAARERQAVTTPPPVDALPTPSVAVLTFAPPADPSRVSRARWLRHFHPPCEGPPLLLQKQSFLI